MFRSDQSDVHLVSYFKIYDHKTKLRLEVFIFYDILITTSRYLHSNHSIKIIFSHVNKP